MGPVSSTGGLQKNSQFLSNISY